jgi:hypothetical protein
VHYWWVGPTLRRMPMVDFLTDDEAVIWILISDHGVDLRTCVADSVRHGGPPSGSLDTGELSSRIFSCRDH